MRELTGKFMANLHVFIVLYAVYTGWTLYEEHMVQINTLNEEFPQIEQEIVKTNQKIKEIEEFLKKTDEYKARVESVAKSIEDVQKQLPAETNDSQILTFFNSEINALNIKDPNLVPGKEEPSTYVISKEYNLKIKGTFLQFLILLERIGNAERIFNIKTLKIIASNEPKRGRFQIVNGEGVIQAYRFNPDFKVDRGFEKVEGPK
jgi:Tfp pilus assembly protein PilO